MLIRAKADSPLYFPQREVKYLSSQELEALISSFQKWLDASKGPKQRMKRLRYWVVFLTLKHTGARLGEVLLIDDNVDVDFREGEMRIINLKRHNPQKKGQKRQVPVPFILIAEIAKAWAEFPELKGNLFKLDASNFRKCFLIRCKEVGIPRELSHPHVLRHTRAIELLRAGVPVSVVQQLLGHSFLSTTAIYLRLSGQEVKLILKNAGIL